MTGSLDMGPEEVARRISNCDFRVSLARYVSNPACPPVITVAEEGWQRHLVIVGTTPVDARLGIVERRATPSMDLYHFEWGAVARTVMLSELVSGGYGSVKRILEPPAPLAA